MSRWTLQASRFAVMGVLATLVHVCAAYLANLVQDLNPFAANLIGFLCAFWVSYLGNFHWTFRGSAGHAVHVRRFAISSALCFLLSNGIVAFIHSLLHLPFIVALSAIAVFIPPLSFALAKFWAFRSSPGGGDRQEVLPS